LIGPIVWVASAIGLTIVITNATGSLGGVVVFSLRVAFFSLVPIFHFYPSSHNLACQLLADAELCFPIVRASALFIESTTDDRITTDSAC
jgi:hypothetical protein